MSASRARTIAFDVLLRVANQGAYADEALRGALGESVKSQDAALATELSLGVLRWQRLLDFIIDQSLKKPGKALDVEVRIALRLGAYQLLFLERIPARAAVYESVELARRARKSSAAPVVNAVLRKIAKESLGAGLNGNLIDSLVPDGLPAAERLGIRYSHPTWLVGRWLGVYGEERTRALLEADNRVPPLSASLLARERKDDAERSLEEAGCRIAPGPLLRDAWLLEGGNPSANEAVRQGWLAIQDEASQAVAHLLGVQPGDSVLDLCAAPGGKTLILARAAGPDGQVIAADLHPHRVRAMEERFSRAGVRNIQAVVQDGARPLRFERPFHRILVDVPCSGTGTLARHPEIRWKLQPADLADFHERQVCLLRSALPHLAPGGRLVYSTCSLEPEENESVVREVLAELGAGYRIVNARGDIQPILRESVPIESVLASDGFFRTFPPEHGTDGFFAAVIERGKAGMTLARAPLAC